MGFTIEDLDAAINAELDKPPQQPGNGSGLNMNGLPERDLGREVLRKLLNTARNERNGLFFRG